MSLLRRRLRPLVAAEVLERLGGLRLMFTVTTGRSGTALLARLLALHAGVDARHEPKPTFSSVLRCVLKRPEVAQEFWLSQKLPAILHTRAKIYAETSHLCCKAFLEPLLELGLKPDLLVLRRSPRAVAQSLLQLGTIPGRSLGGLKYYLDPSDPVQLALPVSVWHAFSDYQLAYWYCLEIAARAQDYQQRWSKLGLRFFEVDFERLTDVGAVQALAQELALPQLSPWGRWRARSILRTPVNERPDKKQALSLPSTLLEAEEEELRQILIELGHAGKCQALDAG